MPRNLPKGKAKSLRQSLYKTARMEEAFLRALWLYSVHLEIADLQFIKLKSRKAGKPFRKKYTQRYLHPASMLQV